ncbi:MAG: hypothetical protein ACRDC9_01430, partial [Plesiomonas shigelloides]
VPSLAFFLAAFRNDLSVVLLSILIAHNFYSILASKMRDKTVRQNRKCSFFIVKNFIIKTAASIEVIMAFFLYAARFKSIFTDQCQAHG